MSRNRKEERLLRWSLRADRLVAGIIGIISIALIGIVGFSYYDMYRYTRAGMDSVEYQDFESLRRINPDVVAWLTLDGTSIDHPVVQGKDNFEYLDINFYRKPYAGGTLFLDEQCPKNFSEEYQLIHGHHMSRGAMFGDLKKYTEEDFFGKNRTGQLLTPSREYDLEILGVGTFDAYDSRLYRLEGSKERPLQEFEKCIYKRKVDFEETDKLLCLSTCSGDMDDRRIVVFAKMVERR